MEIEGPQSLGLSPSRDKLSLNANARPSTAVTSAGGNDAISQGESSKITRHVTDGSIRSVPTFPTLLSPKGTKENLGHAKVAAEAAEEHTFVVVLSIVNSGGFILHNTVTSSESSIPNLIPVTKISLSLFLSYSPIGKI